MPTCASGNANTNANVNEAWANSTDFEGLNTQSLPLVFSHYARGSFSEMINK